MSTFREGPAGEEPAAHRATSPPYILMSPSPVRTPMGDVPEGDVHARRVRAFERAAWPILIVGALLTAALVVRLLAAPPEFVTDVAEFAPDDAAIRAADEWMQHHYGEERVAMFAHSTADNGESALAWTAVLQGAEDLEATRNWSSSHNSVVLSTTSIPDLLQRVLDERENGSRLADHDSWRSYLDAAVEQNETCGDDIDDEIASLAAFVSAALVARDLDIGPICEWLDNSRTTPEPIPTASATLWIIDMDPEIKRAHQLRAQAELREQILATGGDELDYEVASTVLVSHDLDERTGEDLSWLLLVAGLVVLAVLVLAFRTLTGPVYPLIGLGITLVWTYGGLSLVVDHFTALEVAVAPLVLGLGIDYSIHLQRRYIDHRAKGEPAAEAWVSALEHLVVPLALAVITTVAAFLASLVSDIPPLRAFGIASAVGVVSAFITSTLVVGALHVVLEQRLGRSWKPRGFERESALIRTSAARVTGLQRSNRMRVLLIVVLVTVGSVASLSQIDREFDLTDFLADDVPVMQARASIEGAYDAAGWRLVYLLMRPAEGATTITDDTTFVNALQQLDSTFERMTSVVRPTLGTSQLGHPAYDGVVPLLRDAIGADEEFSDRHCLEVVDGTLRPAGCYVTGALGQALLELSRNTSNGDPLRGRTWAQRLADVAEVDAQGGLLSQRIEVMVHAISSDEVTHAVDQMQYLVSSFNNAYSASFTLTATSDLLELQLVLDGLFKSQVESTGLSLGVAFLVLWALTRRRVPDVALLVLLPVALAAIWVLGMMALLGLNWNVMTVMVTALTIGIGIDFSIHVWRRLDRLCAAGIGPWDAVRDMHETTGAALILSAGTTIAGFATLLLSPMPIIRDFGLITALTVLASVVLALLLLPVMLAENALRGEDRTNGGGRSGRPNEPASPTSGSGASGTSEPVPAE